MNENMETKRGRSKKKIELDNELIEANEHLMESQMQMEVEEGATFTQFDREDLEHTHDLFRLAETDFLKNKSYKKYEPEIQKMEHSHIYHSFDSSGVPQEYCSASGGHFHKMSFKRNDNGKISITCGPPLRATEKKIKGKPKTIIEDVWYGADTKAEAHPDHIDTHTHKIQYKGSEQIRPNVRRNTRKDQ